MERVQPKHHEVPNRVGSPPPGFEKLSRWPAIGYVLPFAVFIVFLAVDQFWPVPQPVRFVVILSLLGIFSRGLFSWRPTRLLQSIVVGIVVFFIWIGPDYLIPGYRNFILFSNPLVGHPQGATAPADKANILFLVFRVMGSVVTIPIIEELFWRGWMMRWIADRDFTRIPIGTYHAEAFWIVAFLFASEHGSFWDVGLIAGVIYNWWAIRNHNLIDCMIAHAVTNACLAAYVIGWGQWQYWP